MKNMKLPSTLTQVRQELGLTKAEYAKRAGVSRAFISAIENQESGKYGLNLGDIEKLTKPVRYAPAYARRLCEAWGEDHISRVTEGIEDSNVRAWVAEGMEEMALEIRQEALLISHRAIYRQRVAENHSA